MSARDELRAALQTYDLDGAWTHLTSHLPQHALTQRNHRYALKRYLEHAHASQADILHPKPDFLAAYLETWKSFTPGHARALYSRLKSLYKALRELGTIPKTFDPLLTLTAPRLTEQPGEARKFYTQAEIGRLLAQARGAEERCLVLLGSDAGLRSGELRRLQWQDVHLTEATLLVQERRVDKGGRLDDALRDWARNHGGLLTSGNVFTYRAGHLHRQPPPAPTLSGR